MSKYLTNQVDLNAFAQFLGTCEPSTTKVYFGCDSEKYKIKNPNDPKKSIWVADFSLVAVVHINGNKGCRIFGEVVQEQDFDANRQKPRMRLMNEAIKVAEFYLRFAEVVNEAGIEDGNVEIHLDLNPDPKYNSNLVVNEAVGYIRGMTNVIPFVKPEALASSFAADRYKEVLQFSKRAAIS